MKHMTVQELIDALNAIEDKSLTVIAEGCDCVNPVTSVVLDTLKEKDVCYLSIDDYWR